LETTPGIHAPRIALFIDFDNVILGIEEPPGFDVELVVNALRSRGSVVLGRSYGDWYRHSRHRRKLMEQGIELVETPVFGPIIKNSADIRIALDAFEIGMTQHHIDTFCMVSGDSDFLPLIKRLQYLGKHVIVIAGNKFTSDLVRRNCNEFISYENLLAESVGAMEDATVLEGAFHLLSRSIVSLNERGMEVRSSTVKQMMLQLNPVFSERTFGCNQFKQFLDKACRANVVRLGNRDTSSGEYLVHLPGDDEIPVAAAAPTAATDEAAAKPSSRGGRRTRSGRTFSGRDRAVTETAEAGDDSTTEGTATEAVGDEILTAESAGAETTAAPEAELPVAGDAIPSPDPENALAGRTNLRRGRLRFSGRAGRVAATAAAEAAAAGEEAPHSLEAIGDESAVATPEAEPVVEDATPEAQPTLIDEIAAAEAIVAEPVEHELEPESVPTKKRATRGGRKRKSTKAEEAAAAEAAPAAETEASVAPPVEVAPEPPVEAEAPAEPEAEAPKKPVRRRRTTKKAEPAAE